MGASVLIAGAGIAGAALFYYPPRKRFNAANIAATFGPAYTLFRNKWYFDELYDTIFVKPAIWLGTAIWRGFDDWLLDNTVVEGLGHRVVDVTRQVVRLQSGYLYHYAFAMLIGIAALLTWAIAAGGLLG